MTDLNQTYLTPEIAILSMDAEQVFASSGIVVEKSSGTMSAGSVTIWNQGND